MNRQYLRNSYRSSRSGGRTMDLVGGGGGGGDLVVSDQSSIGSNPRKQLKDCCRKTIAFMCTQVGVGALIVVYALVGAVCFMNIETNSNFTNNNHIDVVNKLRKNCAQQLWQRSLIHNTLNRTAWTHDVNQIVRNYTVNLAVYIKLGYDGRTPIEIWTYPAALMFCLSVFSMIGYGNMIPRTQWGRGATVIYATFGIPLYVLYFMNIGNVLAKTFRWIYTWIYACNHDDDDDDDGGGESALNHNHNHHHHRNLDRNISVIQLETLDNNNNGGGHGQNVKKKIIVPSTACLWVVSFYIIFGTIMFLLLEKDWGFLNALYFCVTSLCKIGLGDFVPGKDTTSVNDKQFKLVVNFVYMLLGMGLVAMCFNLMREDIRVKMQEMKEDLTLCMEDLRLRFAKCCGRGTPTTTTADDNELMDIDDDDY